MRELTQAINIEELLNRLKKVDFMTASVRSLIAGAKHKLIKSYIAFDCDLGKCFERIGFFYLPPFKPIIYTHAIISLSKVNHELIKDLKLLKKPLGDLLIEYYGKNKIKSETISFEEDISLPKYFNQGTIYLSCHKRFILVDNVKVLKAIEYI